METQAWRKEAEQVIFEVANGQQKFTAEDIWVLLDARGIARPTCGSEISSALKRASKYGWCAMTEAKKLYPRNRPGKKDMRPVHVWESRLIPPTHPTPPTPLYSQEQMNVLAAKLVQARERLERVEIRLERAEGRLITYGIGESLDAEDELHKARRVLWGKFGDREEHLTVSLWCGYRRALTFITMMRLIETACSRTSDHLGAVKYFCACCRNNIAEGKT